MLFILLFILIILFIIALFSHPKLSPIPYFPTNEKDLPLIIKALRLKNNQTIFDLGAGDGLVIFKAAGQAYQKRLNTKFIAIEINPVLVIILYLHRMFHPNKKNIKIIWNDLFKVTMKKCNKVTIYLYVSPWLLNKIIDRLKTQLKTFSVVSYMYPIHKMGRGKVIQGINRIYQYN